MEGNQLLPALALSSAISFILSRDFANSAAAAATVARFRLATEREIEQLSQCV